MQNPGVMRRGKVDSCRYSLVITGHSRSKNGVAPARLCPVIHVLLPFC